MLFLIVKIGNNLKEQFENRDQIHYGLAYIVCNTIDYYTVC